jgi:hypothetical protein
MVDFLGRLFQVERRKSEGAKALAGLPQRWHVKGGFFFNFGMAIPAIRPGSHPP